MNMIQHGRQLVRRAGLSIVEVMISLTIAAMLLTAVAAAFTASSDVIDHNDQFFRACQAARVSMNLMLTHVRRADAVQPITGTDIDLFYPNPDTSQPSFSYTYRYDDPGDRILFINNDDGKEYRLASNVTSCSFASETDAIGAVVRVTIALTVKVGDNSIRLSGSAAPRRSQTYN
jgi:type II secretory pathway component PulJ